MSALLVGGAVACAVVAATGPPARSPAGRRGHVPSRRSLGGGPVEPTVDLAAALLVVAAQLRAGATPALAWSRAIGRGYRAAVPTTADLVAATAPAPSPSLPPVIRSSLARLRARGGAQPVSHAHRERVAAVIAATALADDLGAPLAGVLERLAVAVAADAEAEAEVRAAVAGPRATAGVLTWLPVLGLLVGAALGADPVAVVLDGGLGATAAGLGVGLVCAGRWWTRALLRRAAASGRAS